MAAARAAVHVVNIKSSTFNYHLFLYGGSAVGKRHHHRRRPPLAKAVFINVYQRLETACFGRKTARFGGFSAANVTLCNNYTNTRKSRYLGLLLATDKGAVNLDSPLASLQHPTFFWTLKSRRGVQAHFVSITEKAAHFLCIK